MPKSSRSASDEKPFPSKQLAHVEIASDPAALRIGQTHDAVPQEERYRPRCNQENRLLVGDILNLRHGHNELLLGGIGLVADRECRPMHEVQMQLNTQIEEPGSEKVRANVTRRFHGFRPCDAGTMSATRHSVRPYMRQRGIKIQLNRGSLGSL